jgi:hypothetical protein
LASFPYADCTSTIALREPSGPDVLHRFSVARSYCGCREVYFYMTNGEHRVRCAITDRALEVLEPDFGRTEKGRLDAFDTHRAIIERAASTKFDTQGWEDDRITILIRATDL